MGDYMDCEEHGITYLYPALTDCPRCWAMVEKARDLRANPIIHPEEVAS